MRCYLIDHAGGPPKPKAEIVRIDSAVIQFRTKRGHMLPERGDVTCLLHEWRTGSPEAGNQLFALVWPELRRLARYWLKGEHKGISVRASDLVNEAYLRLVAVKDRDWKNRQHFFAMAGRAMRCYLIDHARGRPNARIVQLDDDIGRLLRCKSGKIDLAITVDRLLKELEEAHPDWCMVIEVKWFLGLTDEAAAEALGLKLRTLQRMWSDARWWLFERLNGGNSSGS